MTAPVPRTLTGRVAVAASVAVCLALIAAAVPILFASERADRRALDRDLRDSALRLRETAAASLGVGSRPGLGTSELPESLRAPAVLLPGSRPTELSGAALDPGEGRFARALRADGYGFLTGGEVPTGFPDDGRRGLRTVEAAGERWRVETIALGDRARLEVAAPLRPIERRAARLRQLVGGTLLAALAAAGLLARWLARVALRPLADLRGTAAYVRDTGDLGARVSRDGAPEEVAALAGDLDAMLTRLERAGGEREAALHAARRFAADAGHELRAPLTSLRANLSLAADGRAVDGDRTSAVHAAAEDSDRMGRLVDGLQALARGEAGLAASHAVDLGELADQAVAAARTRHPHLEIELRVPEAGPCVDGDRDGLRRILDNLLENAAGHGRPEGRVVVQADAADGGAAVLTVDDDGPGIPAGERDRVLERFTRGSTPRAAGTGLGLAIVAAEAARHGGSIALEDAALGGLRVRIDLPAQSVDRH